MSVFLILLGNTPNKLNSPGGLYFDEANGDLYISNSASACSTVMKWQKGAPNGTYIAGFPTSAGNNASQLYYSIGYHT